MTYIDRGNKIRLHKSHLVSSSSPPTPEKIVSDGLTASEEGRRVSRVGQSDRCGQVVSVMTRVKN